MEKGSQLYYKGNPEKVLQAEQNSKIKWAAKCSACVNREPLSSDRLCKRRLHWHKEKGCAMWCLDPDWQQLQLGDIEQCTIK